MSMSKKILVVDDNEWILETMYELLIPSVNTPDQKLGGMAEILFPSMVEDQEDRNWDDKLEVTGTHTGEEALEQAQRAIALEEPYAIAFVDQNLNGVDVAIRLKQLDPAIEIVIVTAYFDRQDKDCLHRTLGSGNFHVLHKPFKATAIKRLVESVRPFV
tara:strand:+ start:3619 stop:4095 length:477 start_codon:yes stop_codon:yes gene_type:complete